MADDVSILSDETLLQICRVSQEDLEAMPALGDELRLARLLIPPPRSRHDGRLEHLVALLASVLGKLPQHDLPIGYNSPGFDIKGWVERDALEQVAKQIVGMAWLDVAPDQVASHVHQAATESIRLGLLDSRDYDAWCPGMSSGSGWRIAVTATPYGIAKARAMGQRQGDATAKPPAPSPPVQRTAQDPPWARQPKPEADDGRNSNFCRAALENLKRRAEGYSKQYPSLQHMLVLPEGEYLRVPPPPGCHPLGGSSYQVPPAVTFGESKVAAALPPEDCWPPDLEPIRAVVAEQEFSPYRPLTQKPYRIHLFFGEPAGMAVLQSLAADLVNLSSDVGRAVFGNHTWDMAKVFFHSPDCLHGKDAEILDAWLCTVHWWAWKAVDSPIHTQPRVVFGGSAIPSDRRDHAVDEKLSFSVLDCNIFAATVATIDLFFRFFKQPPDLVWPADYPPEPRPEENAAAGNGERATSDSRECSQTPAAASALPAAQASGTPAQELADPLNAASAPPAKPPASNPSWAQQPKPEAGDGRAQAKEAAPAQAPRDLISRKTRIEFREFLVGWTIREISDEFDAADIRRDANFVPDVSGARRSLVEQFYHTLNFTSPVDVGKLVQAFENILNSALGKAAKLDMDYGQEPSQSEQVRRAVQSLSSWLEKDGFKFENGRIVPIIAAAKKVIDEPVARTISEITRRNIFDALRLGNVQWTGRLSECEFLARLYDLDAMPSTDHRFHDAADDISQHRIANPDDWADDWVFTDSRFNLTNGPDDTFLRFLCEVVHPLIRPDEQAVQSLVPMFNTHLAADGWEIVKCQEISGKPIFGARSTPHGRSLGARQAKAVADQIDADYVHHQSAGDGATRKDMRATPLYFLTARLPYMLLGPAASGDPDRVLEPHLTHEKKACAFYEVDSRVLADRLLELFRYGKPEPGIPGDPNAPVGSLEGVKKLIEGACEPIFEVVAAADLDFAQCVFCRQHVELMVSMAACEGDQGIREDAGLPNDQRAVLLWEHYNRARHWEPLVRDALDVARGKGKGIYLWWTWGSVHPEEPTADLNERSYFYRVATKDLAACLCRAFGQEHGDDLRFGYAVGEALDIDEAVLANDSIAKYRKREFQGKDKDFFWSARQWETHLPVLGGSAPSAGEPVGGHTESEAGAGSGEEAAADVKNWVFDDLPDGEVRARNRRVCERYAALNLEDMLLLCHQWRQTATRFTAATKKAGKYHGHVVHDEKVQDVTKILETAIVSRQMDGASRLSRCLRRPDDDHLHHALATLDILEARLRVETCESGVLKATDDVEGGAAGSDPQQSKSPKALELQAPPQECYGEIDVRSADTGFLRLLFAKNTEGRPTAVCEPIPVEGQLLAILVAGRDVAVRKLREAEDALPDGKLADDYETILEWTQDSLRDQVKGDAAAGRQAINRLRRMVKFQGDAGLVTNQDRDGTWRSTIPFRLRRSGEL